MAVLLAIAIGLFLACANGANDNFKGVATLYGSGTATYRGALRWATLGQILGSVTALLLAQGLLAAFSGKGLVPDAVVALRGFSLSVGLAAALTVLLATRLGFPISTTHALTGALTGAGVLAGGVNVGKLGSAFLAPLLVSPVLAVASGAVAYLTLRGARQGLGIEKTSCVCVGVEEVADLPATQGEAVALRSIATVTSGTEAECAERYEGRLLGVSAQTALDTLHYGSGGVVCFARALNDTPKIAATLLLGNALSPTWAIAGVMAAMACGGWIGSQRVAETMAHGVTRMSPGQGFSANIVTGLLVVFASRLGLPVSTTHVSVGSLLGIGLVTGQARWKPIVGILTAWVTTLPLAAVIAALLFSVLRRVL
jgi:PiT family inorganic phosphate transporter